MTCSDSRRNFIKAAAASTVVMTAGCASITESTRTGERVDVVVLGAGLGGLHAASLLEQAGARVTVLEADTRVGGRIRTLNDLPGNPETGGTQIGGAYKRIVDTARGLGLQLIPNGRSPLLADDSMVYFINGRRMTRALWIASPTNPFAEMHRGTPPDRLLGRLIGRSPLADITAWREPTAATSVIDNVSALDHLRANGLSAEALRLLEVNNSYGDSLADTSLLNLYYTQTNIAEIMKTPGPTLGVAGGNQRLSEAMANALRTPVQMGKRVAAVRLDAAGVEVTCGDGSRHRGRFVICALPLPAMRGIDFSPKLPQLLALAIQQLPYARVTQLHLEVKRQFWKEEGASPYVWSDGPIKRVFPSDPAGTGHPQTLTGWINGTETAHWDALSDADAESLALTEMRRIFPASAGALRLAKRVSWHSTPLAGGAWANWAPGQITRFARIVGEPIGRLHFAGEHCAHGLRGMEGAMESGERAAHQILAMK